MERVSIARIKNGHVEEAVARALDLVGGLSSFVRPGGSVLIKPNLTFDKDYTTGTTTNPQVVEAIANLAWQAGAGRVVIGEATTVGMRTFDVMKKLGYLESARRCNAELADLNADAVEVEIPGAKVLKRVEISKLALEVDTLINVPMLKTHVHSVVTFSLKNLKGVVSEKSKRRMHFIGLDWAIVDLNRAIRPHLVIVDGTIGQEGLGPISGTPVRMDLVIAGRDPVAVDSVCSRVIGHDPQRVPHIAYAAAVGLGTMAEDQIEIVGEPLESVVKPFKPAPDTLTDVYEGIEVVVGKACTGCMGGFVDSLGMMERAGELQKVRAKYGGLGVVVGPGVEIPPNTSRKMWLIVGKCQRHNKDRGKYVPGCPPQGWFIRDVVRELVDLPPLLASEAFYREEEELAESGSE